MSDSGSESPFAQFAAPKPSAVEYVKARRERDRRNNLQRWLLFTCLALGSTLGASVGAGLATEMNVFPWALAYAVVGALVGIVVGWAVGAASWAGMPFSSNTAAPIEPMYTAVDVDKLWSRMSIWIMAWGAIGTACGASLGAIKGTASLIPVPVDSLAPWVLFSSLVGLMIGFALWIILKRVRKQIA